MAGLDSETLWILKERDGHRRSGRLEHRPLRLRRGRARSSRRVQSRIGVIQIDSCAVGGRKAPIVRRVRGVTRNVGRDEVPRRAGLLDIWEYSRPRRIHAEQGSLGPQDVQANRGVAGAERQLLVPEDLRVPTRRIDHDGGYEAEYGRPGDRGRAAGRADEQERIADLDIVRRSRNPRGGVLRRSWSRAAWSLREWHWRRWSRSGPRKFQRPAASVPDPERSARGFLRDGHGGRRARRRCQREDQRRRRAHARRRRVAHQPHQLEDAARLDRRAEIGFVRQPLGVEGEDVEHLRPGIDQRDRKITAVARAQSGQGGSVRARERGDAWFA